MSILPTSATTALQASMVEDRSDALSLGHVSLFNRTRNRSRGKRDVGYTITGCEVSKFTICSQDEASLKLNLVDLARTLVDFDMKVSRRVNIARSKSKSTTKQQAAESVLSEGDFCTIQEQWRIVKKDPSRFSLSYLTCNDFNSIWAVGLDVVRDTLAQKTSSKEQAKIRSDYEVIIHDFDRRTCKLEEKMVEAARQGLLTEEIVSSIQVRWMLLDDVVDDYYDRLNRARDEDTPWMNRQSAQWRKVQRILEEYGLKPDRAKTNHGSEYATTRRQKIRRRSSIPLLDERTLLWWALFVCIVTSVVFFAIGSKLSSYKEGTAQDAEFWFLAQSTTMQLLGLFVTARLELRDGRLAKSRWMFPALVAGVSSILAVPLYLALPTEWSSMLSAIAAGTQSFMILQHLVS